MRASLQLDLVAAQTARANVVELLPQTHHELLRVDDALGVQLLNIRPKHVLQSCAQGIIRQLKVLVLLQQPSHLLDCDAAFVVSVLKLDCLRQRHLFNVQNRHEECREESLVVRVPRVALVHLL